MKQYNDTAEATYGPQTHKNFTGALGAFLKENCPQIGGERIICRLAQEVTEMVGRFYPATSHLGPGQTQWTTIHRDATPVYRRKISDYKLQPVILDLVRPQDMVDRAEGKPLREMKKESVARIIRQAYDQEGVMTNAEVAVLLKMSTATVSKYIWEYFRETGQLLPTRGVIHDLGPTLTHKKAIIGKLYMEGKSVQQVMRETDHSDRAIQRYINSFKQVLLCRKKGLSVEETSFAVHMSPRLVQEYHDLLDSMKLKQIPIEKLLQMEDVSAK